MKFVLFTLSSASEFAAIFIIVMAIFRFKIRPYEYEIIASSFILALVSYFLNINGLHTISMPIQAAVFITLLKIIFKRKILYSILLGIVGHLLYAVIQGGLILIMNYNNLISMDELEPFVTKGYYVSLASVMLTITISVFIKWANEGFSFEFENPFRSKKPKTSNALFMICSILAGGMMFSVYFMLMHTLHMFYYVVYMLTVSAGLSILIYISCKRNNEHFQHETI